MPCAISPPNDLRMTRPCAACSDQYLLANGMNVLAVKELRAAINLHAGAPIGSAPFLWPTRCCAPTAWRSCWRFRSRRRGHAMSKPCWILFAHAWRKGWGVTAPPRRLCRDAYDAEPRQPSAVIVALGLLSNIWHGDRRAAARWLGEEADGDPIRTPMRRCVCVVNMLTRRRISPEARPPMASWPRGARTAPR